MFSKRILLPLCAAILTGCAGVPANPPVLRVAPGVDLTTASAHNEAQAVNALAAMRATGDGLYMETTGADAGIKDAAVRYGFSFGYNWQWAEYEQELNRRSRELDKIFDFQDVQIAAERDGRGLVQLYMLPAVIEAAKEQVSVDADGKSIRLANRMYRILKRERFTTKIWTWRDYLLSKGGVRKPEDPLAKQLPKTADEQVLWAAGVREGWQLGKRAARRNLYNLVLGLREYVGMYRSARFIDQGLMVPAKVNIKKKDATGNGDKMLMGVTEGVIERSSSLNRNAGEYHLIEESERRDIEDKEDGQ